MKRIKKRTALLIAGLVLVVCAPLALAAGEGQPAKGGARNPANDTRQSYTRETEFIASTSTYGTRLSNKSDNGGGAVYGCRSKAGGTPAGNEPCLRATNLVDGLSFEFSSATGVLGGTITVGRGGDAARPFTTNATGVATGLNADRVDGKGAEDFLAVGAKAADADKLDGRDSATFANASDLAFAVVTAAGNVASGRGAVSASVAGGNTFTVVFDRDVSKCAYTVTERGGTASNVSFAAQPLESNNRAVTVDESGNNAVPFQLQVTC